MKKETQCIIEAKKWLNRAWMMEREIDALMALKTETRERVTSITATVSDIRVSNSQDVHKFDKLVELENKIDNIIDRELEVKQEIIDLLESMQDKRYKTLLINRYVRFMTWERIAVQMNYGYRQTLRLHRSALHVVAKELEKMSLNVT